MNPYLYCVYAYLGICLLSIPDYGHSAKSYITLKPPWSYILFLPLACVKRSRYLIPTVALQVTNIIALILRVVCLLIGLFG